MDSLSPANTNETVTPRCPVFGRCGGCQLQHLSYAAQLDWKMRRVREALSAALDLTDVTFLPILPAPSTWFYRRRAQFQVGQGQTGFFSEATHTLVPVETCYIVHEKINESLQRLRASSAVHPMQRIELMWNDRRQTVDHYGAGAANTFFTQVNPEQNDRLRQVLFDWMDDLKGKRVLELYAGAGNFTIPLAERGATVTAVESSEAAVAVGSKQSKGLSVTWIGRSARHALKEALAEKPRPRYEVGLLDPPRGGAAPCIPLLDQLAPQRLFYVSCNPHALAGDLKQLLAFGHYRLERVQPIDFFPQTQHVEVVCELSRIIL